MAKRARKKKPTTKARGPVAVENPQHGKADDQEAPPTPEVKLSLHYKGSRKALKQDDIRRLPADIRQEFAELALAEIHNTIGMEPPSIAIMATRHAEAFKADHFNSLAWRLQQLEQVLSAMLGKRGSAPTE